MAATLTACLPEDEDIQGFAEDDGETGELGQFDEVASLHQYPVDPLGGPVGSTCRLPSNTTWSDWRAPSTLGNGLVHDTRLSPSAELEAIERPTWTLAEGLSWSQFVASFDTMTGVGFRPAQLRVELDVERTSKHMSRVEVVDRSVYIADDDANFKTEIETYRFDEVEAEQILPNFDPAALGARPTSIAVFAAPGQGEGDVGYSLAWVYAGDDMPWEVRVGLSRAAMKRELLDLGELGYRPISIASRERGGEREYGAIFVSDGMARDFWEVSLAVDGDDLAAEIAAAVEAGWYPFRVGDAAGSSRVDVLWTRRPPGLELAVRLELTLATFATEDAKLRAAGYHLETFARHSTAGGHVGVWVRYQPCMRWTGTEFDPDDPRYQARYAMFHERAMAAMDFVGTAYEGRVLRPSSTLHILEGEVLVLSRAYTYAPAIYPDTPLDAPMRLASVSKSITAAAVVMEMDAQKLPLTAPYPYAAGIIDPPVGMSEVSVLAVLRNLGGFRAEKPVGRSEAGNPDSYVNHLLIGESGHGSLAIDGQEMFDYVISGGHLDTNDPDSYWDLVRFQDSRDYGTMHYSNPGFTMLGEAVRRLSGVPYRQYVLDNLAAPLGLDDRLFADPGHRKDARGPTLAGKRAYLINADHPYRLASPDEVPVLAPLFGTEPLPGLEDDASMTWRPNAGPPDPAAPASASVGRYSGIGYLGGALLAAGGWYADGEAIARLIRAINQTEELMPAAVANQLWAPKWKNNDNWRSAGWSYALGCYVRGNWVAWAGGLEGSMATVAHNRAYDFTVVHLANAKGNGLNEIMNPLMEAGDWGYSEIGEVFPCKNDPATQYEYECAGVDPLVVY